MGRELTRRLAERGDRVTILSRGHASVPSADVVQWDATTIGDWIDTLEGADAIVHLSGRRVDARATRRNIDELISSRVEPVRVVGDAVARCTDPPRLWVQSGSLAIFGHTDDTPIDESTTPTGIGPREMVTVCLAWESAFARASASTERAVLLRMGIGLGGGDTDPATAKLAQLVRVGLGGRIGNGRQWVSWVALDDIMRATLLAIDDPTMQGTYHVTSPNPITNADMMATYRRLLGRRVGLNSPAWLTRLGAPLLGSSASLALTGRRALPKRLLEHGFEFHYPNFEGAARAAIEGIGRAPR